MSIEAMKQALEALEYPLNTSNQGFDVDMAELLAHRAIESLRQSIAELEKQENGDYLHQENDGCPAELSVLQRFWRGQDIPVEHQPSWFKQEPVAWMNKAGTDAVFSEQDTSIPNWTDYYTIPLYISQPQRQWAGLTNEEKLVANQMWGVMDADGFIKAIEAKLKEKNT
jgi:hypothetical protein